MGHAAGRIEPEDARDQDMRSELERLGDELSMRRGMHVSLAPDEDDAQVLEVISDLPGPRRARRVSWRDGSFWLHSIMLVPKRDIGQAADWIAAELGWTRSIGLAPARGDPDGS